MAYLNRENERAKFLREKLLALYSEFVAVASADLDRARMEAAAIFFGSEDLDRMKELDDKRQANRRDLSRLALQIRLVESDLLLSLRVKALASSQPYMVSRFPPRMGDEKYGDSFDKFKADTDEFAKKLEDFVEDVLKTRAVKTVRR